MTGSIPLRLAFYGDDFTGSTDAMEALAQSGLRTVLFLSPPSAELLQGRFADLACIGIAGTSRAMSPAEMKMELEPILDALWASGAPVVHYKVCSTFDSSAEVGSIGCVVDLARGRLGGGPISLLAGAPALGRYTVFGNHFAAAGGEVHRLDRHPTMSRHPTTPMHEADLRLHLSHQTDARVALMSVVDLEGDEMSVDERHAQHLRSRPDVLLYDVLDDSRLRTAGRLIWRQARETPHFVVGSSGVEYALCAYWRASGEIRPERTTFAPVSPARQLLVISGSASPVTAEQNRWAGENGFHCLRAPTEELVSLEDGDAAREALTGEALAALAGGHSVLLYTACGPDDPHIAATQARLGATGTSARVLGAAMGRTARELLARSGVRRLVIAGGDTSSYATRELGLYGLEMVAELAPGAPLCRGYSEDRALDGVEIALKGGQMGEADYFGRALGAVR